MKGSTRIFWLLFGLCIAVPVGLWIAPGTRWAVDGQARKAFGRIDWTILGLRRDDAGDAWMTPDFYDRLPSGTGRDARLTRASNVMEHGRLDGMFAAAKQNWNDSLFLSAYLLKASFDAHTPPPYVDPKWDDAKDLLTLNQAVREKNTSTWLNMIQACEEGMRLEPGNAFCPALAASLADATGDRPATIRYLAIAGRCPAWNDHAAELTAIYRRAMVREFGYLGWEAIEYLAVTPSAWRIDLLNFARSVARWPEDAAGIEARRNLIHVAELAYRSNGSFWGGLTAPSGAGLIAIGLADYGGLPHRGPRSVMREAVLEHLDQMSGILAPGGRAATDAQLREMVAATDFHEARNSGEYGLPPPLDEETGDSLSYAITTFGVGAMILTVMIALLLLIPVASLARRLPERWAPAAAMPALAAAAFGICQLPFLFGHEPARFWTIAAFSLFYLLLSIVAARPRPRKGDDGGRCPRSISVDLGHPQADGLRCRNRPLPVPPRSGHRLCRAPPRISLSAE